MQLIDTSAGQPADYGDFIEAVRHIRTGNHEPNGVVWSPDAAAACDGLTVTTGQPLRPPARTFASTRPTKQPRRS